MTTHQPADLRDLAHRALTASGASNDSAAATAAALIAAELDGIASHGLSRLPFYADQIRSGKVDGQAVPAATQPAKAVIRVDAKGGLAFPAIDLGLERGLALAAETGLVGIGIGRLASLRHRRPSRRAPRRARPRRHRLRQHPGGDRARPAAHGRSSAPTPSPSPARAAPRRRSSSTSR